MIFDFHNTDLITRNFKKDRGAILTYPFQTRSAIFSTDATPKRPNLQKLTTFLIEVFLESYKEMPKGCSDAKFALVAKTEQITSPSEILQLMKTIDYHGKGRGQHDYVQDNFMLRDPCSICVELPVWSEVTQQSGFIDLIRYKNEKIIICDFKPPNSGKENFDKVATQLLTYQDLLSRCTKISKDDIKMCFFCEKFLFSVTN